MSANVTVCQQCYGVWANIAVWAMFANEQCYVSNVMVCEQCYGTLAMLRYVGKYGVWAMLRCVSIVTMCEQCYGVWAMLRYVCCPLDCPGAALWCYTCQLSEKCFSLSRGDPAQQTECDPGTTHCVMERTVSAVTGGHCVMLGTDSWRAPSSAPAQVGTASCWALRRGAYRQCRHRWALRHGAHRQRCHRWALRHGAHLQRRHRWTLRHEAHCQRRHRWALRRGLLLTVPLPPWLHTSSEQINKYLFRMFLWFLNIMFWVLSY